MMRLETILLFVLLSVGLPPAALAAPRTADPALQVNVERVMIAQQTKLQITRFAGIEESCMRSSPRTELCEWRLSKRESGWRPLAAAIRTRDRIVLLCELPTSGGPRAVDACSAHPQRSNRGELPQSAQGLVRAWFADAATLTDLSRLMGAMPESCVEIVGDRERCLWRTTSRVYGHGSAALLIGASMDKKVRVSCVFPSSGGPRDAECVAEIGA